jgi:hypothetical protein
MSIGETLTQARDRVGLSITDVSERTRIRETIIRDIEHNEFRSCGGDFYARGHIRAIAQVVGTDPVPLIEAYDQTHEWSLRQEILRQGILGEDADSLLADTQDAASTADDVTDEARLAGPRQTPDARGSARSSAEATGRRDPDITRVDNPMAERTIRLPEIRLPAEGIPAFRERSLAGIAAFRERLVARLAVYVGALRRAWERLRAHDGTGAKRPGAWERGQTGDKRTLAESFTAWAKGLRRPEGSRPNVTMILTIALLAAIGAIAYLLAAGPAAPARPATGGSPHRGTTSAHSARNHPASSHSPGRPAGGHSSAVPASAQVSPLYPAAAIAFGPGGASQGDNPQLASQALAGKASQAWHTSWYTTAHFGGLQNGTGLLLDMGKSVTVTSAQLTLGIARGANLQLLAGNQPQMADLRPIAGASDAGGGSLVLKPAHPARARYLLIWFTQLPPNHAGTYEAWISDVAVKGLA